MSPAAREADAPDRRADIVLRSAELFDNHGYHATSVNDIADAVGISKPTLYHYVKGKDEILYWIHQEFSGWLIDRQQSRNDVPMTNSQRILETMADIFELMDTRPGHVRTFFEHHRELPAEARAEIGASRDRYFDMVRALIKAGIESGEIRPVDPTFATLALFGVCNWAYQWYRPTGPMPPRQIAYLMFDILANGWSTRPEPTA